MFFTTVLAVLLRTLLVWENKKLDAKHGQSHEQTEANEDYGPGFRFVL